MSHKLQTSFYQKQEKQSNPDVGGIDNEPILYVITMIIFVWKNMKWMMTLNLYLISLKKILHINYTYVSLKQPTAKNILWRVTILFISQRMDERGLMGAC